MKLAFTAADVAAMAHLNSKHDATAIDAMAQMLFVSIAAQACHEANRAYCASIGDTSQVAWNEAPQWQRDSKINGVMFRIENPNSTPEQSHENWMKQKAEEGWKYGDVKNVEKKEHPCFTEYKNLPAEQRFKDALFIAIVDAVMP